MIDIDKLPDDVVKSIARNLSLDLGEEADFIKLKRWLETTTDYHAFDRYLTWQGVIGYTRQFMDALDAIRAAGAPEQVTKLD